jgi:nitric oxide reductase subunit B
MDGLRWMRIPGDTLFAIGALVLGWFVLGLRTGWSLERRAGTGGPGIDGGPGDGGAGGGGECVSGA